MYLVDFRMPDGDCCAEHGDPEEEDAVAYARARAGPAGCRGAFRELNAPQPYGLQRRK